MKEEKWLLRHIRRAAGHIKSWFHAAQEKRKGRISMETKDERKSRRLGAAGLTLAAVALCLAVWSAGMLSVKAATTYYVKYYVGGTTDDPGSIYYLTGKTFNSRTSDKSFSSSSKTYLWLPMEYTDGSSWSPLASSLTAKTDTIGIYESNASLLSAGWSGHKFMGWYCSQYTAYGKKWRMSAGLAYSYSTSAYRAIWATADGSGSQITSSETTYTEPIYGSSMTGLRISLSTWFGKGSGTYLTVYPMYASNSSGTLYAVTYNLNGGTYSGNPSYSTSSRSTTSQNVVQRTYYYKIPGTLLSFTPSRTGYKFGGWNTNSSGTGTNYNSGSSITVTAGTTLYAQWTANTYTIAYDKNGGSGTTMSTTSATYDSDVTLRANTYTRTGYTFLGWSTDPDATTPEYEVATGTTLKLTKPNLTSTKGATVTLYAIWQANTITVKYHANGGSGSMLSSTFTYGTPSALSECTFTRTGYTFVGWYAYREVDSKYYFKSNDGSTSSSGATTGWYKTADSCPGVWVYYVYKDKVNVSKTAPSGTVHMYALWSKDGAGWTMEDVIQDSYMFYKASELEGGEGTTWDGNYIDSSRAREDKGSEDPGYFTQDPY